MNDILFIDFNDEYLKSLKKQLSKRFKMTDLDVIFHYLKMSITRSNGRITLNQKSYLQAVLKRFEMTDSKTSSTFMNKSFSNIITFVDTEYRADADIIY